MLPKQLNLMFPRSWLTKPKTQFVALSVHGYVKESHPKKKSPKIRGWKGLFRVCQEFDRLQNEKERELLCHIEPTDKREDKNLRIHLPPSLFLVCLRLRHYNKMGGHVGASKTYNNARQFYYWRESLTRFVRWLLTALGDRIANCSQNTEIKFYWKKGKTRLFHSARTKLTTKDPFSQQVIEIFLASCFLIYSSASGWYTPIKTVELKLLSLLSRNGYALLEFLSLLYTTEAPLLSILTSLIGLKNWASLYDPKQHTRLGLIKKTGLPA